MYVILHYVYTYVYKYIRDVYLTEILKNRDRQIKKPSVYAQAHI